MRIAVTGGGGFIGSAVISMAESLGHQAWRFDRADGNDILGDLGDLAGANTIIHLAGMLGTAELFDTAEEAVHHNVIGTLRVLRFCEKSGTNYVGITMPDSSWANVYQATKLCSNRLASAWHRSKGIGVSHVRAFNAYGPGQKYGPHHPQKILPTFATMSWARQKLPIWGNGLQTVDLVHVDDIARMLVEATGYTEDEVFDAGTGKPVTVKQVARYVNSVTGNDAGIEHFPMRDGETPLTEICAQGSGWAKLGWIPQLDWQKVASTVEWYKP